MTHPTIKKFVLDALYSVILVIGTSLVIVQAKWSFEDARLRGIETLARAEVERIDALEFSDIVRYDAILPGRPVVYYESEARHKSLYEVLPEIENIKGGVRITWNEYIFCDHNPYDSSPQFAPYREVEPTTLPFENPKKPRQSEALEKYEGYPAQTRRNNGFHGNLPPVTYPNHDADCYMQSQMVMKLPEYNLTKRFTMSSEAVKVRGVVPE